MRKQLLVLFCVIACAVASANAALIGQYTFASDANASSLDANIQSFSVFNNNTAGGTIIGASGTPSGGAYRTAAGWDNTFNKYVQFTITPNSPYYVSISSVDMVLRQNDKNSTTPMKIEIYSGTTLLQTATATLPVGVNASTYETLSFNFTPLVNPVGTLTFRIFAQVNDSGNNFLEFNNVAVNGVTAIPEPTTVALGIFGLGTVAFGVVRRLRKNVARTVTA